MSGDRGVSLPVAALGVLAFFFSTALLTQHAFDLLRLSEGDSVKERPFAQPPVEARLWEDPLAAVVRHQERLKEKCSNPAQLQPGCPPNGRYDARLPAPPEGDSLTVIAALVPGSNFVGVEEARRRIRYAILSGLASVGFVPESSERLGLLTVPLCGSFEACPPAGPDAEPARTAPPNIPYDALTTGASASRRRIAILWIDDSKLGARWLSNVVVLLGQVVPVDGARLNIIGPYTSDKLVDALEDVALLSQEMPRHAPDSRFCANWNRLKRVDLISPFSTADDRQLISEAKSSKEAARDGPTAGGCEAAPARPGRRPSAGDVADPIDERFRQLLDPRQAAPAVPFFRRTIGPDSVQIAHLRTELCARGVGDGRGGRIVVLREWDSIYARSLADKLGKTLECPAGSAGNKSPRGHEKTKFDIYTYFAGIDGVTLEGVSKQQRLVPRAGGDAKRQDGKEVQLEWPENRDQRDYIRRLVLQLQQEAQLDPSNVVRAVGIIGQDVHDKLVLAQALRPAFRERMIFTTDMDARLLHPEVVDYTRNLVIASALPLSPSELDPIFGQSVKISPFRDIYQTATFLAARYAALMEAERDLEIAVTAAPLQRTYLYEIGRRGAVKLASRGYRIGADDGISLAADRPLDEQIEVRRFHAILLFLVLAAAGGFIVFVKPGPALHEAIAGDRPFDVSTMVLSGLTMASWGFAAGVVAELAMPGRVGLAGALAIALAAALLFWIAVYPGPLPGRALRAAGRRAGGTWLVRAILFAAVIGGTALPMSGAGAGTHESFAFFSGASSWPSELLRALGVLLFGWFVDHTWRGTAETTQRVGARYFAVRTVPKTRLGSVAVYLRRNPKRAAGFACRRLAKGLRDATLWMWRPHVSVRSERTARRHLPDDRRATRLSDYGAIDGARIWRRYIRLLHGGPRFLRTALWLAVAFGFALLEQQLFGGEPPDVPARGLGDRALFSATTVIAVVATIVLMVLVSDATVLTWRFIRILRDRRTIYPPDTIERFATELGPELEKCAARPIAARIHDRNVETAPQRNSILDPWIDAQLLADHTDAIARLIFFPLILLGLLFLARSPLFDNWAPDNVVIVVLVTYLLWTIAMASMLNVSAEIARRGALEAMRRDLLWLQGSGEAYRPLAERFPSLIKQVEDLRKGAFAPFFEQPLVRAVLVPLGGAGGLQLLELLAFTRS